MRTTAFRLLAVAVCTLGLTASAAAKDRSPAPGLELRALWVDAFHPGIQTREEAEQLVAAARRANFNALMIQVRRRGDALYHQSFEPFVEDAPNDPGFDPLANIIEVAHRNGIEVHAWINAAPVWRDQAPPRDPRHVFNQHGPSAVGDSLWLTANRNGDFKFPVGYFLDLGHPAAADYIARVYLNVVRHYAVDGIHFDYIRYPETEGQQLPRGADVGYNAVSLERFRRATGRTDTPAPDDPQWIEWRRQQVTQLVRRVYVEAKAINPKLKVTAAVIAWGRPPVSEQDFENVAPMQRIFQNWHAWLKEGILDMALPMNYAAESRPQVRDWFNGWIDWEKRHRHGRQLAVGIGAYLNTPEDVLAQIARVRQESHRQRVEGICFFSYTSLYRTPAAAANGPVLAAPRVAIEPQERVGFLVSGAASWPGPFAAATSRPPMPWIDAPRSAYISGVARKADGSALDGGTIRVRQTGLFARTRRVTTDGNGYFGLTNLKPGKYRLQVEARGSQRQGTTTTVELAPGRVAQTVVQADY